MKARSVVGVVVALWLLGAAPGVAWACSCIRPSPCAALSAGHSNIFEGTVESIEPEVFSTPDPDGKPVSFELLRVHLGDVRVLMGRGADSVTSLSLDSTCAIRFKIGQRYLIDARDGPRGLATSYCSFTTELPGPSAVLDYLATLSKPGPNATLSGSVGMNGSDPLESLSPRAMAGLNVSLSGAATRSVTTDDEGRFAFERLPAGTYHLAVAAPKDAPFRLLPPHDLVIEHPHECVNTSVQAYFETSLDGGVVDHLGKPLANIGVVLRRAAAPGKGDYYHYAWAETDEFGRYRFEGLAPDRYVVGLNIDGGAREDSPYLPGLLLDALGQPEVADLSASGYVTLPPLRAVPVKMITVRGKVAWPDASRAGTRITVSAMGAGEGNELTPNIVRAEADADGWFELRLAERQRYSVTAFGNYTQPDSTDGLHHSDDLQVVAGQTPIALVVRRQ